MTSGLTADEPYQPDDPDILGLTGVKPGKSMAERAETKPAKAKVSVHAGKSRLATDEAFEERLADIDAKLDSGQPLSDDEADYMSHRAISRLLRSNRPMMVARAVALLQVSRQRKFTGAPNPALPAPTEVDPL